MNAIVARARLVGFALLLGLWCLVAVLAYGWYQRVTEYPDRRMPGYDAWVVEHRP